MKFIMNSRINSNYQKMELLKEYISLPEIPKVGEKFVDCSQFTPGWEN